MTTERKSETGSGPSTPDEPAAAPTTGAGVLFVCTHNAIRSPMAGALYADAVGAAHPVVTAGVYPRAADEDAVDPMAAEAMREIGLDLSDHHPRTLADIEAEGGDVAAFDAIIALSPFAAERARDYAGRDAPIEIWEAPDPSAAEGRADERLGAYRALRDTLDDRIRRRFRAA